MSISSEIARLQEAKSNIITAITQKGVVVPEDALLDNLGELINGIQVASVPAIGFLPTQWDDSGCVTDGEFYGNAVPNYCCACYLDGEPYKLTEISLPESILIIGESAFTSCISLTSISLPTNLNTIDKHAFNACTNLSLTELPDTITTIGNYAFSNCTNILLNKLPDNLTTIGTGAFDSCNNISITEIPVGVSGIPNYAFSNCEGITTLTFRSKPEGIGRSAFNGCINLTTINVPWAENEVAFAPWGAEYATINYNYTGE